MDASAQKILSALEFYVGSSLARPVLQLSIARSRANISRLRPDDSRRLIQELEVGLRSFVKDQAKRSECMARLSVILNDVTAGGSSAGTGAAAGSGPGSAAAGTNAAAPAAGSDSRSIRLQIGSEHDIVMARGAGRDICRDMGFPSVVQVKVATAISELARNIVQYVGAGAIEITRLANPTGIEVLATDDGPGIPNLDDILSGRYRSRSGMGMGIMGTRNLVDEFDIDTGPGKGTRVRIRKFLR